MKYVLILLTATCLTFTTNFLGQESGQPTKTEEKGGGGPIDTLTDTKGFNLRPYLAQVIEKVRSRWFEQIPNAAQSKRGHVAVKFRVAKDGKIEDVKLDTSSGDEALDRAAYKGIAASNPLPSLPSGFACQNVELRFNFYYNPGPGDIIDNNDHVLPCVTSKIALIRAFGVTVSPSSVQVAVASTQQFYAAITGLVDSAVIWSIAGSGCERSDCGSISSDGLYTAPAKIPNPATISVTATTTNTPAESASSVVTIVRGGDAH